MIQHAVKKQKMATKNKSIEWAIGVLTVLFFVFITYYFEPKESKKINIFNAAIYGQVDLIKENVNQGKNMDIQDEFGATLLHYSLQSGHSEISKFLVISEANVNIRDKEGLTPLDWAHWMNQVETAKLIREYDGKTSVELGFNKL